jgi:hypothetical protein
MKNLITEVKKINRLMGLNHKDEIIMGFETLDEGIRDKLKGVLTKVTKNEIVKTALSKTLKDDIVKFVKIGGKKIDDATAIEYVKQIANGTIDTKTLGKINQSLIKNGSTLADDAIEDFIASDAFKKLANNLDEGEFFKKLTSKANGYTSDQVKTIFKKYKANGGKFSTKVKTPKFTPKDLKAPEEIAKYNEKIKAFQQSQAALNKNIKPGEGTRNRLAREARDEVMKLAQQATNNLSSGTKSKILEAFKNLGPKSLKFLETLKIVEKNAVGKYQLTTIGLLTIPIVAGGTIGLVAVIINFMSKGVDPEPEIKTILTQDELKKVEQQDVKKEVIRFEDEAYKKEIKVALGKSPDEAFTDEDINLIYKKFVDNNLIQTK